MVLYGTRYFFSFRAFGSRPTHSVRYSSRFFYFCLSEFVAAFLGQDTSAKDSVLWQKKIQIFGFFAEKPKKSRKRFCSVKLRLLTYSMLYQCRLLYSAAVYHCRFTWKLMPVAAVSVKLHLRHGRSNERTDAGNRIGCILALKCDIWWH